MELKDIVSFIQVSGLATVLLVGLLVGLYKLGRLTIEKAVIPMAEAHVALMNEAKEMLVAIKEGKTCGYTTIHTN